MITPRKTTKPDMRKPLDLQSHASGFKPTGILEGWARSGDATARPEFDHGLQRKQQKARRRKWF
jgi:hypothetical protein